VGSITVVETTFDWKKWFSEQVTGKIQDNIRDSLIEKASREDGGYTLANDFLPKTFPAADVSDENNSIPFSTWATVGVLFVNLNRQHEALAVFDSLYRAMCQHQVDSNKYIWKAFVLVWISEVFLRLGYLIHAKRYLMYALCEDAAKFGPDKRAEGSGVYFRAVWQHGIPDELVVEYTRTANEKWTELKEAGWFPERVLSELDHRWITGSPSDSEYGRYWSNPVYVSKMISQLGKDSGQSLEWLAHYLISAIPGARAYRRKISESSEYDVVGSFEGPALDFRSELGRYFLCECKDWDKPADFTSFAKLARVLDSIKSRFGVLFSKNGISGQGKGKFAEREQLKVFADRGIAIIVIAEAQLERIAKGESFLAMLRSEYERIRLDLP
jgi:hypothetical protein